MFALATEDLIFFLSNNKQECCDQIKEKVSRYCPTLDINDISISIYRQPLDIDTISASIYQKID